MGFPTLRGWFSRTEPKYCTDCRHIGHEQADCDITGYKPHSARHGRSPARDVSRSQRQQGASQPPDKGKVVVEEQVRGPLPPNFLGGLRQRSMSGRQWGTGLLACLSSPLWIDPLPPVLCTHFIRLFRMCLRCHTRLMILWGSLDLLL